MKEGILNKISQYVHNASLLNTSIRVILRELSALQPCIVLCLRLENHTVFPEWLLHWLFYCHLEWSIIIDSPLWVAPSGIRRTTGLSFPLLQTPYEHWLDCISDVTRQKSPQILLSWRYRIVRSLHSIRVFTKGCGGCQGVSISRDDKTQKPWDYWAVCDVRAGQTVSTRHMEGWQMLFVKAVLEKYCPSFGETSSPMKFSILE